MTGSQVNISLVNNQDIFKNSFSCRSLLEQAAEKLRDIFLDLPPSEQDVFKYLVWANNKMAVVEPSQGYIAGLLDYDIKTINRAVGFLNSLGFITKIYRHRKTCIYKLASFFNDHFIRSFLSAYIKGFRVISLSLLRSIESFQKKQLDSNVLPIISLLLGRNILTNFTVTSDCKDTCICLTNSQLTIDCKGESRMEEKTVKFTSPVLENLQCMSLTDYGKIALSCFPDEALLWADRQTISGKNVMNEYKYFRSCCDYYCKTFNAPIDVNYTKRLLSSYKGQRESLFEKKEYQNIQRQYPSSRLETQEGHSKKGYSRSSSYQKAPMDLEAKRLNKEIGDRQSAELLRKSQLRTWTKMRNAGSMNENTFRGLCRDWGIVVPQPDFEDSPTVKFEANSPVDGDTSNPVNQEHCPDVNCFVGTQYDIETLLTDCRSSLSETSQH